MIHGRYSPDLHAINCHKQFHTSGWSFLHLLEKQVSKRKTIHVNINVCKGMCDINQEMIPTIIKKKKHQSIRCQMCFDRFIVLACV